MKQIIEKILNEYIPAKQETFAGHTMGSFFRNDIPQALYSECGIDSSKYLIVGSVGQGNWATVPWICIFERSITTTATKGIYIVYLLAKDGKTLYLTFNQGCTDIRKVHNKRDTIRLMREKANKIASQINSRGFCSDENIDLGSGLTGLAELYQKGTIFYKAYHRGAVPEDVSLQDDLEKMLEIYQEYVQISAVDNWIPPLSDYNPKISKAKWVELLNTPRFFTENSLYALAAMYDFGGAATCTQLETTYGRTSDFYRASLGTQLASKVREQLGLPYCDIDGNKRVWPILFQGRGTSSSEPGSFIWRIRPELHDALTEFDILRYLPTAKHSVGKHDSWEIIDETTAVKNCDKSFFEHNGSGVPKGICWFFDADELQLGETKNITIVFQGNEYFGRIANESSDRRRVNIYWNPELGRAFNSLRTDGPQRLQFKKGEDHYTVQFIGGEEEVPVLAKEYMKPIKDYIAAKGFSYDGRLIENFYLSLKTKPFVILAGTSGTGKTRLVKLFAEAIGAEYKLVPVRPDWSDSSDLFGHMDLNGKFVPGAVIDFIKSAQDHPGKPYFLCLDEMNLARVEYYLSDVLSVIETRDLNGKIITSDPLIDLDKYGSDENAKAKYGKICFPQNLYIVGTVNMDETTFPFSKKVLDRANTIEFNFVDLRPSFDAITDMPDKLQLPNSFLQSEYLLLAQCNKDVAFVSEICNELQQINEILQKANAHIGYRVRDEIVFYLLNNKNEGELLSRNEAMDNAIMQKILPRIQGSSASIHDMLCELFKICGGDHNQRSGDSDADKMWKVVSDNSANCKYPNSAKKLQMTVRRFEEDGFTSFWL